VAASRLAFLWLGPFVVTGIVLAAALLDGGPSFSLGRAVLFAVLYALVSRTEFEVGDGAAIPTELVLVPMLFTLPIGAVPAVVAVGLLLRTIGCRPWPLREPMRAFLYVTGAGHAFGPVLVIALAGGLPLRWSAWPVYTAALAAQFAFDFAVAIPNARAHHIPQRAQLRQMAVVFGIDAALAPTALLLAFAVRDNPMLLVLVLPLVVLLWFLSRERRRRIDQSLDLIDAYRGSAALLGVEPGGNRNAVDLVQAVGDVARTDALTGAANRRAFDESLATELSGSRDADRVVSLLLVDIDHFKSINDRFGHVAGDAILVQLFDRLRTRLRDDDLLVRWGGEEIAILPRGIAEPRSISALAEDLRSVVSAQPFVINGEEVSVTISVGVALAAGAEDLIAGADAALYAAKQGGRDRVVLADDHSSSPAT
jgi:diguanylate cyclase (GGDEF)-like protein